STPTATATATAEPELPPTKDDLAFAVSTPHLKGVLAQSKLPEEVKTTVAAVLDGKRVAGDALKRARDAVPAPMREVLDEVAGGKSVHEAMDSRSGLTVAEAIDPDAVSRWKDFSARSAAVEQNLEAFATAFNSRDAEGLVKTMAFPFFTDTHANPTPEAVKQVFTQSVWNKGSKRNVTAKVTQYAHMPSEAFQYASKLGAMVIEPPMRDYVTQVLGAKPGYVSLCIFALENRDDGTKQEGEEAVFVSRKSGDRYLIVAVQD
ncbi:MAG: hypothetical protein JRI68_15260, partial [Deltaproteobacteria bacterium]|nr:hypothetical protein [Deltaproteobacteria bacterium]